MMTPAAVLPPTTHALPKPQRLRLMRSTRKLSALLGTTPLLVDPRRDPPRTSESPLEPLLDNQPRPPPIAAILVSNPLLDSIDDRRPSASLVPVATHESGTRPTLLLRINTVPPRCNSRRGSNSHSWGRPASLVSPLPSPVFPTQNKEAVNDAVLAAARRKKMARVARILGENVPLELVFPDGSLALMRSPRTSVDSSESEEAVVMKKKTKSSSLDEVRFANVVLRPKDAPFLTAAVPATEPPSTRPAVSSVDRVWSPYGVRRSMSQQRRDSHNHGRPVVVMRTELGWTGEWNQEERAVLKGLRELREK